MFKNSLLVWAHNKKFTAVPEGRIYRLFGLESKQDDNVSVVFYKHLEVGRRPLRKQRSTKRLSHWKTLGHRRREQDCTESLLINLGNEKGISQRAGRMRKPVRETAMQLVRCEAWLYLECYPNVNFHKEGLA